MCPVQEPGNGPAFGLASFPGSVCPVQEPGNGPAFGLASFPGSCVPGTRAWEWACFWSGCALLKWILFCVVLFPGCLPVLMHVAWLAWYLAGDEASGIASLVPGRGRG